MNGIDLIKEYLVGLGFQVDNAQYAKMKQVLNQLDKEAEGLAGSMAASYAKAGTTIIGVIGAITTATVGLMDKMAQQDLDFKLFALNMYMSEASAKKLKISTDALGRSLDEIAWNPELRARYFDLMELQKALALSPGADASFRRIRDIRQEFTKLKVESQYAMQNIVFYLTKYLGGDMNSLENSMKRLNKYIVENMPDITKKIAGGLAEVVKFGEEIIRISEPLLNIMGRYWSILAGKGGEMLPGLKDIGKALEANVDSFTHLANAILTAVGAIDRFESKHDLLLKLLKVYSTLAYLSAGIIDMGVSGAEEAMDPKKKKGAMVESFDKMIQNITDVWNEPINKDRSPLSQGRGEYSYLLSRYFPGNEEKARRVMMAESRGNAGATNANRNGTQDTGLFQINDVHLQPLIKADIIRGREDLKNPDRNFAAAQWVYNQQDWGAWRASESRWGSNSNGDLYQPSGGNISSITSIGDIIVNNSNPNANPQEIASLVMYQIDKKQKMATVRQLRDSAGVFN